ncbi:MAG: tRNA threonylcarbamoyladenosine biosynthesis protein TsaB [Flavobacteriales bacterium]
MARQLYQLPRFYFMDNYILAIETATKLCSVGVSKNGTLVSLVEQHDDNYTHAENLHPFIQKALLEANITANMLSAVAVSKGPGSYTGLRIGVSAAKGLCYALNIPLIGVETLDVIALAIKESQPNWDAKSIICPVIDARRMEVFTRWFTIELAAKNDVHAAILEEDTIDLWNQNNMLIGGDGAIKLSDVLPLATIIENILPSAKYQLTLAYEMFNKSQFESTAYFEPYYLKDFIAGKPKKML